MNKKLLNAVNKPSIYKITNTFNSFLYIGSSLRTLKRWNNHLYALRHEKHDSLLLQYAFNKYGEDAFQFEVIEYIENPTKENVIAREQYWLDFYQSYERDKGYNTCRIADSPIGIKRTEENKQKISDTLKRKNRLGQIENGFKNKHHTKKNNKINSNIKKLWWANPVNRELMRKRFANPETRKRKLAALEKALAAMKVIREKNKK